MPNNTVLEFEGGFTMKREYGETPNGNDMAGMWVLRNSKGKLVDFDQYRFDIIERRGLKKCNKPNYVVTLHNPMGPTTTTDCSTEEEVWHAIGEGTLGSLYEVSSPLGKDVTQFIPF